MKIAENLWLLRYPLSILGAEIGRTVTLIRLSSGEVLVHSTGPFTLEDISFIHSLGQPAWLVEATLFHDTFAEAGRVAFPNLPYGTPEGFKGGDANLLRSLPAAWAEEIEVLGIQGIPRLREHVFLHRPTRTLIVADLVFNFGPQSAPLTRWVFRWAGGIKEFPGMSRLFRSCIRDRQAFAASMQRILEWDFDRLIVGHGNVIESGAKARLASALRL